MNVPLALLHAVSRERVVARRDRLLRRIVAHAYERVPYYRRLLDGAGLRPDDVRSVDDLGRLPLTSRATIQALPVEDTLAAGCDPKRLLVRTTSGSTGAFLAIRRAPAEQLILSAFRWRALYALGLRPWDKVAVVGLTTYPDPGFVQAAIRLLGRFGLFRTTIVDCRQEVGGVAAALAEARPDAVVGIPGAISQVCAALGREVVRPKLVVTGGEVLTPLMRRQMAEAFGAPVRDIYGSHEFRVIAWECTKTGEYHTSDDTLAIEVLAADRPAAPGEAGELVATNLYARAMPFLRYRLGDVVVRGSERCPCGAPFATLRAVEGRMIDYLTLPDGRLLHPYTLSLEIPDRWPWIRRYQLLQERRDRVRLRVEAHAPPGPDVLAGVRARLTELLGPGVEVSVEVVDALGLDPNGKFRVTRSLLSSAYESD
jgi:phenylacetate-CoA ligase